MLNSSSIVTPHSAAKPLKYFSIRARSKRSIPAGTGVWVVNTPPARTASTAASNVQPASDQLADAFEAEEPGMALVAVEHLRVDPEGAQGPDAADAEDDLLAQPVVRVAAVEAVGDGDAVGRVAVDVGVEQVQGDLADVGAPDPDGDLVAGEVDRHAHPGVGEAERLGVHVEAVLLLPAVGVELLVEVALGVQQADADERARRGRTTPSGGRRRARRGRRSTAAAPR